MNELQICAARGAHILVASRLTKMYINNKHNRHTNTPSRILYSVRARCPRRRLYMVIASPAMRYGCVSGGGGIKHNHIMVSFSCSPTAAAAPHRSRRTTFFRDVDGLWWWWWCMSVYVRTGGHVSKCAVRQRGVAAHSVRFCIYCGQNLRVGKIFGKSSA